MTPCGPDGPEAPDREQQLLQQRLRFLCSVPILQCFDESELSVLAAHAEERMYDPGDRILAEGDDTADDAEFYVIRRGQADVIKRNRWGDYDSVARLGCGSYFGELGLLTNGSRNASVEVAPGRPLTVLAFDAKLFHSVIAENVLVFRMKRLHRQLARRTFQRRLRVQELSILADMPALDRHIMNKSSSEDVFEAGEAIFQQGDDGDRFYILLEGEVDVERDGVPIAKLHSGDFFGETALLFDTPRTATIRATASTVTWSITRAAFQRVVGHYLLGNQATRLTVLDRFKSARAEPGD